MDDAADRRMLRDDRDRFLGLQWERMREFVKLERGVSRDARDDVVQNALVRHVRELDRGKDYAGVPLRVVARQLVRYAARDHFQATAHTRGHEVHPDGGFEPGQVDRTPGLELWDLCRRLDGLPGMQRDALCLLYGKGLDHEQVAARLGMTRNAVDQALHRGRTRLRASWNG